MPIERRDNRTIDYREYAQTIVPVAVGFAMWTGHGPAIHTFSLNVSEPSSNSSSNIRTEIVLLVCPDQTVIRPPVLL